MSKEYRNINELYETVLAFRIFDLTPHVAGLDPSLEAALEAPPTGLYLPGGVEPFFEKNGDYSILGPTAIPVTFGDILKDALTLDYVLPPGNIRDNKTSIVVRRMIYERIKRQLKNTPAVSASACHAARAVVYNYLNGLCRHTSVYRRHYDLESIVKPDYHHLIEDARYETAFDNLVLEVQDFVGRDTWSLYSCSMKGNTLLIEKGLDFRIVDWHRQKIEASEGFDHDRGGVQDGYDVQDLRSRRR